MKLLPEPGAVKGTQQTKGHIPQERRREEGREITRT